MAQLQFIDALESVTEWVYTCNIQLLFLYMINFNFILIKKSSKVQMKLWLYIDFLSFVHNRKLCSFTEKTTINIVKL